MTPRRDLDYPPSPAPPHLQRRRKTDRENGDWMRVRWSVVFQVIGFVVGLIIVYNTLTNRITAMETAQGYLRSDVSEIKADVKMLLRSAPK
jgi:cytochrome c biogenesis protein CcdA